MRFWSVANLSNLRSRFWTGAIVTYSLSAFFFVCGIPALLLGLGPGKDAYLVLGGHLIVISGVFVAFAQFFQTQMSAEARVRAERSRFYLDSFIKGAEQGTSMLENEPPTRENWIAIARILATARSIEYLITEKEHRDVLEIYRVQYRNRIAACLDRPVADFFGVTGNSSERLEDLARLSYPRGRRILHHDEGAIFTIWDFAEFPDDYDDPVPSLRRFSARQLRRLQLTNPNLFAYLSFIDQHDILPGSVRARSTPRARE